MEQQQHKQRQQQSPLSDDTVEQLMQYSACDISDALVKLKVPGAGFIADLIPYHNPPPSSIVVAPVSTVVFAPKGQAPDDVSGGLPAPNIPKDANWVDLAEPGTIAVLQQPPGQTNAICGGIMALRMQMRQVRGIVVAGRVRDLDELRSTDLPIWGYGTSTVGAGAASVPRAIQVPVQVGDVVINPGDVAFHDPVNGVVIIPRDKVAKVLEVLPELVAADAKVKEDVLKGMSVYEAFKLHRFG